MPLLQLLTEVVKSRLYLAVVDYANAIGRVVGNRAILGLDDIATLAVDDSHLAIWQLHHSTIAAKVARPDVDICYYNIA